MVSGSLRLPPPLKLVAMIYIVAEILLKVALKPKNQSINLKPLGQMEPNLVRRMKDKIYYTVETVPKSNLFFVDRIK